jgi:uncharacterized protein DUF397
MEDPIDPRWRKSTRSSGNGWACVEVGTSARAVFVRDTAGRNGATLTFGSEAWRGFIIGLKIA